MRQYEFVTIDVFTDRRFGGNPLAVVLGAEGLSDAEMQSLAAEFNYSETTFVLAPADPAHTARVRIFNRRKEMDFAGHPNVGTGLVLAARRPEARFTFEERAGLVEVEVERDGAGRPAAARIRAPQPLRVVADLPADAVAACLGLAASDLDLGTHGPVAASVGITFVLAAVRGDALERIVTHPPAFAALVRAFPALGGRASLFVYRDAGDGAVDARMFAPLEGTDEDPATGSAAAALVAYRLSLTAAPTLALRIRQGVLLGRPSLIEARAWREDGFRASVAGPGIEMFRGTLTV